MKTEKPKKVPALDPEVVNTHRALTQQIGRQEKLIIDRIDYILKSIYQVFGYELRNWYFSGADEGQLGELARHLDKDGVYGLCLEPYIRDYTFTIITKDGGEWELGESIPTHWLFEDFEKELDTGRVLYQEKQSAKTAKKQEKALQREARKRQALQKLSAEEQKILGLS